MSRSTRRVHLDAFEVGSGSRTVWAEDLRNEVSVRTRVPEIVWGAQLPQAVNNVTDHVHINALRRPIGLVISYVVTF